MKTVSVNLEPGTSVNVTLKGNYTKMEGPYKAKLKSYYADSTETKTRVIEGIVSEILSPIKFIQNAKCLFCAHFKNTSKCIRW